MSIDIKVNAKANGKTLKHFWSECVGAGRANEGLRANWQEQLKLAVKQCGFKYIRFHGLFHDDMFVYSEKDGCPTYNWQYIDELFDKLLDIGIRPFVELGFCPKDMASGEGTCFWWKGRSSPPKDYSKWGELVRNFVQHCIWRYGLEEVRKWYFEVWNEPNLDGFFRNGTKSQYFKLYKASVEVLKGIDCNLKVGGPATSNFVPDDRFEGEVEDSSKQITWKVADLGGLEWKDVWIRDIIEFCEKEKLPLDFISTHPYPTDFALDEKGETVGRTRPVTSTQEDLTYLNRLIAQSPFPNAEIHLTEWNSSPSPRDYTHDYLQAATYIVKANIESTDLVDSLSCWTFTDVLEELGAGDTIFHGGFGLINFQGIVKPAFHAYRFLHLLGDEEIARQDGCIVTRHSADGRISALAYHYPAEMPDAIPMSKDRDKAEEVLALGLARQFHIELTKLKPGTPFVVETLDKEYGFALKEWEKLGCPEPPTCEETLHLRKAAMDTRKEHFTADRRGTFVLDRKIDPWNLVSIRETA